MTCFTCERNLSAYIDDELTADSRLEVEAHLDACEGCRKDYKTHLAAREAAGLLRTGPVPDGLWDRIESALRKQRPSTTVEDMALIVRGLASELRGVRQAVQDIRRDLGAQRPADERPAPRPGSVRLWSAGQLGIEKVGGEKARRREPSDG